MEIKVKKKFFLFFQALPKHRGVTKPLHKKRVTIKRGHVNIYLSLMCSARSFCLRNITKPLIRGTIYNEILCWLISTSQEMSKKPNRSAPKKEKSLIIRQKYASLSAYSWAMSRKTPKHLFHLTGSSLKKKNLSGKYASISAYSRVITRKTQKHLSLSHYLQMLTASQ